MRKILSCVLMITLLLTACGLGGGSEEKSPENLAVQIRAEYLNLAAWTATMAVHMDYGERVYDFKLNAVWEKDGETFMTVTEPEMIAGISARIEKDGAYLEYDGVSLSTGPLTGEGMNPLEAIPFFMEQLTEGYMARCSFETEGERQVLKVFCRDPNLNEGEGTECTLYFEPDSRDLLRVELSWNGFTAMTAELTNFTKEMTENDEGNGADLG